MPRPPALPAEAKLKIVLAVLAKERTVADAARHAGVSEQSIVNWRRQFLDGAVVGLGGTAPTYRNGREESLVREVRQLRAALGEAQGELRALRQRGLRRIPHY